MDIRFIGGPALSCVAAGAIQAHCGRMQWGVEPRLSFNRAVDPYDAIRPSYPAALFDALFEMLPPRPDIVEVGPGTGQATRDLLGRGASIHAVEIGPEMAVRLRTNLRTHQLHITVGDFEEQLIDPASVDVVFSATAYHWISPAAQLNRPAQVLRPGGLIAIVDLVQVSSPEDVGFFDAAQPIYQRYGQGHAGPPTPRRDQVDPAIRAALTADDRFADILVRQYDWDQTYSAMDYRTLMLSYSVTQMMDRADRERLLDDIQGLIGDHFGGCVTRPLVATLTTARLTAESQCRSACNNAD